MNIEDPYWQAIIRRFKKHLLGLSGLAVFLFLAFLGIYAPFFASSKPLLVIYDGDVYFPLIRYLFYKGFFTKGIDLFFNLLMFFIPILIVSFLFFRKWNRYILPSLCIIFAFLFIFFERGFVKNPESSSFQSEDLEFLKEIQEASPYAKLNLVLKAIIAKKQHEKFLPLLPDYIEEVKKFQDTGSKEITLPTLYQNALNHKEEVLSSLKERLKNPDLDQADRRMDEQEIKYIEEEAAWVKEESKKISLMVMPLVRPYHWEEEAGGDRYFNRIVNFQDKTRINRKDLTASLFFGIRISLVVGILSTLISVLIGIPIGAAAGYFAGIVDLIVSRFLEIWESMPAFFMLLMIVSVMQAKSIFIIIFVIGLFGWTSFSRFIRGEFLKQRQLSYVDAAHVLGLPTSRTIFSHILPNAIPPVLTLLPFAIMGAVTAEAGLSFLGLGEEGSSSLGVLMDEGRTSFPGESYLLWPPAALLTVFLISIALVGDALRDTLDPKGIYA